jgi:hypothetical protein
MLSRAKEKLKQSRYFTKIEKNKTFSEIIEKLIAAIQNE